jgi:small ligand-binding sensory domain FIST
VDPCLKDIEETLSEAGSSSPDFLAVFASPDFDRDYPEMLEKLGRLYPAAVIFGCTGRGVIGDGEEAEFASAISVTAAWLPGVRIKAFHAERASLPGLDASREDWKRALLGDDTELQGMLIAAEPFSFPGDEFLAGVDYAYPKIAKVGGLASGGQTAGSTALFNGQACLRSGVVGVGFYGDLEMSAVVAQGCRPIGKPMVVTGCAYNEISTLDGQVAGDVVLAILRSLPPRDRRLASQMLFLGVGAGAPKLTYQPGDFLIRQVLGVDPQEHSLVVNATLRKGQTVQLHLRDGRSSSEDVECMLELQRRRQTRPVRGGLLFSCVGRGRSLYGHSDHDSSMFRAKLGDVPLGGFFCNGELGPVGGVTSLHGFTSCFAVFS